MTYRLPSGTGIGRAFEFVEPLLAIGEVVEDDRPPLRAGLLDCLGERHASAFHSPPEISGPLLVDDIAVIWCPECRQAYK